MGEEETPHTARTDDEELAAGLSEAARGVIRQSADPRLDAHLARMLSDSEAAPRAHRELGVELERTREELAAARADVERARADVERARAEAEHARAEATTARRRITTLIWLFAAAVVAILILLVVVALR